MTDNGDKTIRAFLGIELAPEVKKAIYELQQRLRKYALKARWKYIENYHLTLKFLDQISMAQWKQIDAAMREVAGGKKPFDLIVSGMGVFAGKGAIRVLWLGLSGDLPELYSLQREIDQALTPLGFPPEKRPYRPHITIGQDIVFECPFDQIRESSGEVHLGLTKVDNIYLFKSEQVQQKRVYSKLSEYQLNG